MLIRDVRGADYANADIAALFPCRERPAESSERLALVTVMQFSDGHSTVWKHTLGLELTEPGFDLTVLSEYWRSVMTVLSTFVPRLTLCKGSRTTRSSESKRPLC